MEEEPILYLIHNFTFKKNYATYSIEFFKRFLVITNVKTKDSTKIKYSKVYKFKLSSKSLKIILQTREKIKFPCTIAELKKMQKLFKKHMYFLPNKKRYVAFVEFGDRFFFIKIKSNEFYVLKTEIIKRIGNYFFPVVKPKEPISLKEYEKFTLRVRKDDKLVTIDNSQDLDAVLLYFNYKIDIVIGYK